MRIMKRWMERNVVVGVVTVGLGNGRGSRKTKKRWSSGRDR
jgi:hypothetical protein